MTKLTEDQFIEKYKPEQDDDGGYYRQRYFKDLLDKTALAKARKERRIWTAVEDDHGHWGISNGVHPVNNLYQVITKVPWGEDDDIFVQDEMHELVLDVVVRVVFLTEGGMRTEDIFSELEIEVEDPHSSVSVRSATALSYTEFKEGGQSRD
jgi:hypothetical protein